MVFGLARFWFWAVSKLVCLFSPHDLALGVCSLDLVFEVMLWVIDGTERGAILCEIQYSCCLAFHLLPSGFGGFLVCEGISSSLRFLVCLSCGILLRDIYTSS